MCSKDKDTGDELSWHSVFDEVKHQNLRRNELNAAGEINFFSLVAVVGCLMNMRRVQELCVIVLLVVIAVENKHQIRWIHINLE